MTKLLKTLTLLGACLAAVPAVASATSLGNDSIPFVSFDTIQNWTAPNDHTVYLQTANSQWYRADLAGSCPDLPFAFSLGVQTTGGDTFDNFSNIIVDHDRCPVMGVTKVSGPPSSGKEAPAAASRS